MTRRARRFIEPLIMRVTTVKRPLRKRTPDTTVNGEEEAAAVTRFRHRVITEVARILWSRSGLPLLRPRLFFHDLPPKKDLKGGSSAKLVASANGSGIPTSLQEFLKRDSVEIKSG